MVKKLPKCPTWDELREIVEEGQIDEYLNLWPKKMKKAVGLALSVAHWSPEARTSYDHYGHGISGWCFDFDSSVSSCGLCSLYYSESTKCRGCPLNRIHSNCNNSISTWREFQNRRGNGQFHKGADKMYNTLVELYSKEWETL